MTNLLKLPTWADKQHIYAVVETPRGSTCKLDFDSELRAFTLAKPLMAGLTYPYDWGFIPSTKAEDGAPLETDLVDVRRLPSRARQELEQFFRATNALEEKEIEFLGWRGPAHAIKTIERLTQE
jgi:inorganic pyrophosphatase